MKDYTFPNNSAKACMIEKRQAIKKLLLTMLVFVLLTIIITA